VNVNNIYIAAANCQVALAFVKMASVEAGWEAGRDFGFARQLVRKPAAASPRPKIAQPILCSEKPPAQPFRWFIVPALR
jgi:hypothetical protein